MSKNNKPLNFAHQYVVRWRNDHDAAWIGRQVWDNIQKSWRDFTIPDYQLSPDELAAYEWHRASHEEWERECEERRQGRERHIQQQRDLFQSIVDRGFKTLRVEVDVRLSYEAYAGQDTVKRKGTDALEAEIDNLIANAEKLGLLNGEITEGWNDRERNETSICFDIKRSEFAVPVSVYEADDVEAFKEEIKKQVLELLPNEDDLDISDWVNFSYHGMDVYNQEIVGAGLVDTEPRSGLHAA
jgi:hypothetical protein